MIVLLYKNLTQDDKIKAVQRLISGSTPSQDFFFMILLSVLMATFGLILNNVAVIIGSMLVAPMLHSILSLSLGIIMADTTLISRSIITIAKSIVVAIAAAVLATLFFASRYLELNSEIISRTQPSLLSLAVAIVAGLAASFALVKPKLNETLPGVAISVALIPPLAVIGIGLARLDWEVARQASILFGINIIGIVFAAMVNFSLMNFYLQQWVAHETVKKEEDKIAQQREIAKLKQETKNPA